MSNYCQLLEWLNCVHTDYAVVLDSSKHLLFHFLCTYASIIPCLPIFFLSKFNTFFLPLYIEDTLKVLKEKCKEPEPEEAKPEPTTEILYLCSYVGCNKSFPNEGSYRKHSHIHGERQYACSHPGCLKKFLDSSKLKRHQVVHTGVKNFRCPVEGCGKAFNLDFNLRAHMRTHSQEHYHVCPYSDCGKRYTQECKLKAHIKVHHEKNNAVDMTKSTPPAGKLRTTVKTPAVAFGSGSSERPFVCHYKGCGKNYIHEYKLNLHLKNVHELNPEDNSTRAPAVVDHVVDEASDQDAYIAKGGASKNSKRGKPSLLHETPSAKVAKVSYRRDSPLAQTNANPVKKPWPVQEMYDEDSEETEEEEQENVRDDRWRYHQVNGDDDEETDDEE
ncbi:putative zinc finger protein-like [Iris pallida]|uniref:Zinc finger protein-like n=1 Tax=Iris pallida TaxID=29817 RepID=A0AAX6GPF8_IRIPA|nr:putative zinc finger protein-like [Iris pallida]